MSHGQVRSVSDEKRFIVSKIRYLSTRFWFDNWVSEELYPLDRYVMIYLLTNDRTTLCGVYESSLRKIAFETGLELKQLKTILKKLEPKVYYVDGWVVLVNMIKHQSYKNPKIVSGIQRELCTIPPECIELLNLPQDFEMDMTCPVSVKPVEKHDSLSISNEGQSHLTITNTITKPILKPNLTKRPADGMNKKTYAAAVRADEALADRELKAKDRKGSTEPMNVTVRKQLEAKGILKS
jgi:hypothetical protein